MMLPKESELTISSPQRDHERSFLSSTANLPASQNARIHPPRGLLPMVAAPLPLVPHIRTLVDSKKNPHDVTMRQELRRFRAEVERRFGLSVANREYVFPRGNVDTENHVDVSSLHRDMIPVSAYDQIASDSGSCRPDETRKAEESELYQRVQKVLRTRNIRVKQARRLETVAAQDPYSDFSCKNEVNSSIKPKFRRVARRQQGNVLLMSMDAVAAGGHVRMDSFETGKRRGGAKGRVPDYFLTLASGRAPAPPRLDPIKKSNTNRLRRIRKCRAALNASATMDLDESPGSSYTQQKEGRSSCLG